MPDLWQRRRRGPHQQAQAEHRGEWDNRWWVECLRCQGTKRNGDYIKELAAHLNTNAVTLLKDAKKLLREAGLLLDSNSKAKAEAPANGNVKSPDLKLDKWPDWHDALLAHPEVHGLVGGTRLVKKYGLLLVPGTVDRSGRAALGFPVYEGERPVNLVRRFFRGQPRYRSARDCQQSLWPDLTTMPADEPIVLVAGMRDACFARAARLHAYTTTAGVASWSRLAVWAPGRDFTVAFDQGESHMARNIGKRLIENGADSVRIVSMPSGVKDLAELQHADHRRDGRHRMAPGDAGA